METWFLVKEIEAAMKELKKLLAGHESIKAFEEPSRATNVMNISVLKLSFIGGGIRLKR